MAWSPLAGGELFKNQSLNAVRDCGNASRFDSRCCCNKLCYWRPAKIVPVLGTNNIQRIRKLHAATQKEMDRVVCDAKITQPPWDEKSHDAMYA